MPEPIYLDYAATTPVDPLVLAKMQECLLAEGNFGNPASSTHVFGWRASEAVEEARAELAELIGADPREIVWTSGATESDNLAIKGVVEASGQRHAHIVTSRIEHKAVIDSCKYLESVGHRVTWLAPDADGLVTARQVENAVRDDTALVSIMYANNEIGTVNDIAGISEACARRGVPLHVDAAQMVGKLPIDVSAVKIDLMSISGHKLYGPKGIGALYVRRAAVKPRPQIHGGGHEFGLRSGTLATHQIVGLGEAARIARAQLSSEVNRLKRLRDDFLHRLRVLDGVRMNGSEDNRLPALVNLSFEGVDGETLINAMTGIAVSNGSACTSASVEPSYVLSELGLADELAFGSVRFSFGRFNEAGDAAAAASEVLRVVRALRST
ncbi:MAG: aminotransferase class V-fold PLP-dependent enzyme [Gammaproteobacteria bacterium]|nr:aminotransferase class V-fold PLP-dependent enzyme [Gammaproteobacteria bacterium]